MTINIKKPLQIFYGTSPQICPYLPNKNEKKIITEISGINSNELNFKLTNATRINIRVERDQLQGDTKQAAQELS